MDYDNVTLWFAKDENEEIITIDDINETNKRNNYFCPMCTSSLIPKAVKSKQVTSHFAHVDASKCTNESMIHWWFKNKFIEKGDSFVVVSDKGRQYICKDILVEQDYKLADGKIYNPDVTVLTECGSVIYFEMDYSNKKIIKDYIDIWIELGNIVVEVDVKKLMNKDMLPTFRALFYSGKCFNTKKNDTYYNTIGMYKESKFNEYDNENLKEKLKRLDWFWDDIIRFKKDEVSIEYMVDIIDHIDGDEREVVQQILNKKSCAKIFLKYVNYKIDKYYNYIISKIRNNFGEEYLKHIRKSVDYINYGSGYRGYIHMYDINEHCWYLHDIKNYSLEKITESANQYIENIIKYNKIEEIIRSYNKNAKYLDDKIKENNIFKEYEESITSNKANYKINCLVKELNTTVKYYSETKYDLNKFNVVFSLIYNDYRNEDASDMIIKIDLESDIEYICNMMINKFNDYFKNLDYLKNINELDKLSEELRIIYSEYKIKISSSVYFEDIYNITIYLNDRYLEDCYISNKGILSRMGISTTSRGREMLLESDDIGLIKNYLINHVNNKIKEEYNSFNNCIDCKTKFTLELGEIKFFIQKGFNLPKRCKKCREIKKKNIT